MSHGIWTSYANITNLIGEQGLKYPVNRYWCLSNYEVILCEFLNVILNFKHNFSIRTRFCAESTRFFAPRRVSEKISASTTLGPTTYGFPALSFSQRFVQSPHTQLRKNAVKSTLQMVIILKFPLDFVTKKRNDLTAVSV